MSGMMLTAVDALTSRVLDLTAMNAEMVLAVHGTRTARRNGHEIVCRQCEGGVHLVRNHHQTTFWRHNPGSFERCILSELGSGESPEHIQMKKMIVLAHRSLKGWTAEPEKRFERDGEIVIADVWVEFEHPRGDAASETKAWEAQLARQTDGEFTARSDRILLVTGRRAAWATPHADALGTNLGVVTNPSGTMVIDRIYSRPDGDEPLPPMMLDDWIKATSGSRPRLRWSSSGEYREWISYPSEYREPPERTRARSVNPIDTADRPCDREPPFRGPAKWWTPTNTDGWNEATWSGRARMAHSRAAAGLALDPVDVEAIRRYPEEG